MSTSAIKECFALFDRDGDGAIPRDEIDHAIRACGANLSEKEMEDLLMGKDGALFSYPEFEKLVSPLVQGKDIKQELTKAFKAFDRDNSGSLSTGELQHVLYNLSSLAKDQVDLLIKEADPNKTGRIPYQQLIDLFLGN